MADLIICFVVHVWDYWADLLLFTELKTDYVPSSNRDGGEARQCLTDCYNMVQCILHLRLSNLGSFRFHHFPCEGSSVSTFITLGLHDEEFSIRSGSNKSSLTGETVHWRKWKHGQRESIVSLSEVQPQNDRNGRRLENVRRETCFHQITQWRVMVVDKFLSYLKVFFSSKCLISGMCFLFCSAMSALIFAFPSVISGSPPSFTVVDSITKALTQRCVH